MANSHLSEVSRQALLQRKVELEKRKALLQRKDELLQKKAELEKGLKQPHPESEPSEDSLGKFAARTGKSLAAGAVGGLADTATAPYNLAATAQNLHRQSMDSDLYRAGASFSPDMPDLSYDTDLPLIPSATEAIDNKIDQATGGYTTTPEGEKPLQAALKAAAGVATPGGLGKAASAVGYNGLGNFLNTIGSLKPSSLLSASAAGAATEAAQQAGHSSGRALGEGLAAGLLTDLIIHKTPRSLVKLSGLGKKNLDLEGVEIAKELKLDLPNIAFTKSQAANMLTHGLGKAPHLATKMKDRFTKASDNYKNVVGEMLDDVGPQKTEEISKEINRRYTQMKASIPKTDTLVADDLLKTIQRLESELDSTIYDKPTKALLQEMNKIKKEIVEELPKLPAGFEKMSPEAQTKVVEALNSEVKLKPVLVKRIINQKKSLNRIMKDKDIFNNPDDAGTLKLAHQLQDAADRELEKYGVKNPELLKNLRSANELYAETAKRQTVEKLFGTKLKMNSPDEVNYGSLVNIFENPKNHQILKNNLGEANYKKTTDLMKLARNMQNIKKYNPNPSGTAWTAFFLGFYKEPVTALAAAGLTSVIDFTLNNKKLLNLAVKYAKEPTAPLANQIADLFKRETGMTLQAVNKIMHEQGDEKEED